MSGLKPQSWQKLDRAYQALGYIPEPILGNSSHILYWHKNHKKIGQIRPVSLPKYKAVGRDIILNNIRTGKMDKKKLMDLL